MRTLITCPKCRGDLHPDFTAYCDKCNLDFTSVDPVEYAQVCEKHGVKFEQYIFNWECPVCMNEPIEDDETVEDPEIFGLIDVPESEREDHQYWMRRKENCVDEVIEDDPPNDVR